MCKLGSEQVCSGTETNRKLQCSLTASFNICMTSQIITKSVTSEKQQTISQSDRLNIINNINSQSSLLTSPINTTYHEES